SSRRRLAGDTVRSLTRSGLVAPTTTGQLYPPDNPVKGERTSGWSSAGPGDLQNSGNHLEPSGPPDRMPTKKRH
ncbi:hypothetical protein E4U19_007830, partial [Claviceps sp. Clav32 group G5]